MVVAGESGTPDLSVGKCVGGVIRRQPRLFRRGGAHDDVQAGAVEPAPHIAHGHAVLEEDHALVGTGARAVETILDEWIADVGQDDGLGAGPSGIEAGTCRVEEDEAVLREPIPVRAGAFNDEDVPDAGGMGASVAIQRLGIVTCAVMTVHVEPGARPVGW